MTKLVNCTKHPIIVDGIELPPHDHPAEVREKTSSVTMPMRGFCGTGQFQPVTVNLHQVTDRRTIHLPAPQRNTYFIVSTVVARHNLDRHDLVIVHQKPTDLCKDVRDLFQIDSPQLQQAAELEMAIHRKAKDLITLSYTEIIKGFCAEEMTVYTIAAIRHCLDHIRIGELTWREH
jgi:hypothetical protein